MNIVWTDPAIQSALIQAVGALISTLCAAIAAALIGRQFANRKKLQQKLEIAQADIQFLLAVERAHCELHQERTGASHKHRVRRNAIQQGLAWSGRFTPGRVKAGLDRDHATAP